MTAEVARAVAAQNSEAKDHNLVSEQAREAISKGVHYEKRPVKGTDGKPVAGLFNAWITLDNPNQFNSYTTDMVKATILAFRAASAARDVVAVVFTGAGDKAFCTGGNTKEYAEYYAGNPQEYRGYMRLFNDMVSAILGCDKPVICRVNGMRIGGGQEIGMACDFSIASDNASFGRQVRCTARRPTAAQPTSSISTWATLSRPSRWRCASPGRRPRRSGSGCSTRWCRSTATSKASWSR